jgi:hypothetical protein
VIPFLPLDPLRGHSPLKCLCTALAVGLRLVAQGALPSLAPFEPVLLLET